MVNQSFQLTGSVGAAPFAQNHRPDVQVVQRLLNQHAKQFGYATLPVTGLVTEPMVQAIKTFQAKAVGMRSPDGRVDRDGKTIGRLNQPPGTPAGGTAKAAAPAPAAGVRPPQWTPVRGVPPVWTSNVVARMSALATMVQYATAHASATANRTCSRSVGNAINAGIPQGAPRLGLNNGPLVRPHGSYDDTYGPASGGAMGPKLVEVGFRPVKLVGGATFDDTYPLEVGDVIVLQTVHPTTGANTDGHVAIWTGTAWVSDFTQPGGRDPNVYKTSTKNRVVQYEVFRLAGK